MAKKSFSGSPQHSLVIPVYRNEDNIDDLVSALEGLHRRLNGDLEIVFVVDGSPDRSFDLLTGQLSDRDWHTQVISHSRNFGSFAAMVTGLSAARGQYCAVMAADLQEPIELIEEFFETLRDSDVDIVVGRREGREDGALSGALSNAFWWLFRRLVQPEIPRGGVDVFGCTRQVAQTMVSLPESNSSLVGLLYWVGYKRAEIGYRRQPRQKGQSAWTFRRRFRYLTDSLFSFTNLPITVILLVGAFGSAAALLLGIFVFVSWLAGAIQAPGYTTLVLVQLASTAALLLAIGVVGTYVWRTFDNTKNRPHAIVHRHTTR